MRSTEFLPRCSQCEHELKSEVGQSCPDGGLRWYQSVKCSSCEQSTELDDIGFPPFAVRKTIIDETGLWVLSAEDQNSKIASIKALRSALTISMSETATYLNEFPKLYVGTLVECQWLENILRRAGVFASYTVSSLSTDNPFQPET